MSGYTQTKRDYIYLEDLELKYAQGDLEISDQIGAADEVFDLMADPTKARAREMYITAINAWFRAYDGSTFKNKVPQEYKRRIENIRKRQDV